MDKERKEEKHYDKNQEVHSTVVRAGKRTYFFDVKATKSNDLYLTVTESKKTFQDGQSSYQKHKIFLYKEDFEKFSEALNEAFEKITELKENGNSTSSDSESTDFSSLDFEDL
ncbi:MAG TPA: DUF3276 family protein [Brumimicrobium sp.]|nr:DUF3276 family protein [Brumimicrobium sp.]